MFAVVLNFAGSGSLLESPVKYGFWSKCDWKFRRLYKVIKN